MSVARPPWRIALAGIAAESCTFSPLRSELEDFVQLRGEQLRASTAAADFMDGGACELRGGFLARALPGGMLAADTFATLRARLLAEIEPLLAAGLDGIVLDLHGALAAEGCDDAEYEILRELRACVGPALPLAAAFDLHGNLTAAAAAQLDVLTAYRTAPHIDVAATRRRARALLERCMAGQRPQAACVPIPVLLTGEQTATTVEPGKSAWQLVAEIAAAPGVWDASLFVGYAWADQARSGACAVCYADGQEQADDGAARLRDAYWDQREAFTWPEDPLAASDCVAWLDGLDEGATAFLSDAADNPTAGGVGDAWDMLALALADADRRWLIAGLADPAVAQQASDAGVGAEIEAALGGRWSGRPNPQAQRYRIVALADSVAVLACGATTVLCTARRRTFHELEDFTDLGIELSDYQAVVIKVGYLPPAIARIARRHRLVSGAGCVPPDISALDYQQARFAHPPHASQH